MTPREHEGLVTRKERKWMKQEKILEIGSLTVQYPDSEKMILRNINLDLYAGEITCVIGESGSGKSTLLQSVLQLPGKVKIAEGKLLFEGKNLPDLPKDRLRRVRGTGIGVVFQEPGASLNPIRKIYKQFYDAVHAHDKKVSKSGVRQKATSLLKSMEFTDPERILDSCPAQLSGGMNQRVAIALAMILDPRLLLVDEPTSALDVTVQAQVVNEVLQLREKYGTSILFITHNMGVVAKIADQVAVMYGGQIVEYGLKEEVLYHPVHPYTKALLAAIPKMDGKLPKGIYGRKPDEFPEKGCVFASRCPYAYEVCTQSQVKKQEFGNGHWAMCVQEVFENADNTGC